MTFIVRLALALALIVPALTTTHAQTTFGPTKGGSTPGAGSPTPGSPTPGAGSPTPGGVFRPSGSEPAPAAPPTMAPAGPAAAPTADWGNSQVEVRYVEPQDPQFAPIRDRLMRRQVLEQLRLFLSPLKLPSKLVVQLDQCNAEWRPYQSGGPVTICYEHIAKVDRTAPRDQRPDGLPREMMIVGAFVQSVLHEVAVAIFDVLEIPVWGRESDAADKLAGFIMVQFGKDVALKVMVGAAWYFDATERTWNESDYASESSPEAQRFFNYLCIAYGSDPATFKFLIDQNMLPVRRAQRCTGEFYALRYAFAKTILPHVDVTMLKRVQSASWLMLEEPK
jgi:Putative metallopeptidase